MPSATDGRRLIRGAEVLAHAGEAAPSRRDIWIEHGRIAALTEPGGAPFFSAPFETIEAPGRLAIPGLVNAHSHSYSALLRGTVPGEPLDLFVMQAMARPVPRSMAMVRAACLLHALEMLRRGITAQVDHLRYGALPGVEPVGTALTAYRDIGLRSLVAPMYDDLSYLRSLPLDPARLPPAVRARWQAMTKPAPEAYFEAMGELLGCWRGDPLVGVVLGVDGPQRCSPRLLALTGEFMRAHGVGLHTHLLEARTQALMVPPDAHGSMVGYMDRHGLVGPGTSFAHFVWCTPRDMELAAERGATVSHNPVSNLHLGSGIAPLARLRAAGVNVGLGTDGQSGASMSVLEQAKFASLLSRVTDIDHAHWVDSRAAFAMATTGGARIFATARADLADAPPLGTLMPGAAADLALLDLRGLDWRPRGETYSHLVMYEAAHAVDTVLVAGDVVLEGGRATRLDEAALLAEVDELAAQDERDNAGGSDIARAERAVFAPLLREALARDLPAAQGGLDRFARLG